MKNDNDDWCQTIDIKKHLRSRSESEIEAIHQIATNKLAHLASDVSSGVVKFNKKSSSIITTFNEYFSGDRQPGHIYFYNYKSEYSMVHLPFELVDHLNSIKYGAPCYTVPTTKKDVAGWFENKMALNLMLLFNNFYPKMWTNQLGFFPAPDGFVNIHKMPFDLDSNLFILEHEIEIDQTSYTISYIISDTLISGLNEYKETSTKADNIARLEYVELDLTAILLRTEMTIEEVSTLKIGSLIPLGNINLVDIETNDGSVITSGVMGLLDNQRAIKIR
ncbi:FliM/FliN family flagellar motor C-terminal domain-containing protein [Photobacterium toruni]|uniref:FliM/FliN family flagellar motor C-terminal domain-containing protein n=1 Tax=Photobacterium toruni TaxID=1935446 RepID=UPI00210F2B26|nr:FliM/FliN family flagellar motor C-terminal domain-containing protein [Photobacterium toruni]